MLADENNVQYLTFSRSREPRNTTVLCTKKVDIHERRVYKAKYVRQPFIKRNLFESIDGKKIMRKVSTLRIMLFQSIDRRCEKFVMIVVTIALR